MNSEPSAKQQELQSLTSHDALSAIKSNIVPNQEYLLQGSIIDNAVDVLIHRLRGLCDNTDNIAPETFHDHEICFTLMSLPGQTGAPLSLRLRRALDDSSAPWLLRYMGQPEIGDNNRPTMVRSVLDVHCGADVPEFLKELGCRKEFEFVTKGYIFRKGLLKILVGKLYRVDPTKSAHDLDPVSVSHYVEMSVVVTSGSDAVGEDMKSLAEQLKPLVILDKVDVRRLP